MLTSIIHECVNNFDIFLLLTILTIIGITAITFYLVGYFIGVNRR